MINPDDLKVENGSTRHDLENRWTLSHGSLVGILCNKFVRILLAKLPYGHSEGKMCCWDITMSTQRSTEKRMSDLRDAGYSRVDGLFVDIPVETSIERTDARHREGHNKYRDEVGLGGRYVPAEVVERQSDPEFGSQR